MRQAGLLGVAMLCCLELVVTAQVNLTEPLNRTGFVGGLIP
jgi:hypothetical protein